MTTLDNLLGDVGAIKPSFVKIDVEGFELHVLRGATELLRRYRPALMVAIQADHQTIATLARERDYIVTDDTGALWTPAKSTSNTFWLHRSAHRHSIDTADWLSETARGAL